MGILDGIVEWIAEQIMAGLDLVTTSVLGALGCDMTVFLRYFPAAETMYGIFVVLAVGLILLNWVWQLFKNFGLSAGIEAEDPVKLSIRSVLFILLALFSDEIINTILTIGGTPYRWIMDSELPPLSFADFNSVMLVIIGVCANGAVALITLILVVILAWNYLKLLLEVAERYVFAWCAGLYRTSRFCDGGEPDHIKHLEILVSDAGRADFSAAYERLVPALIYEHGWFFYLQPAFAAVSEEEVQAQVDAVGKEAVSGNVLIWFMCAIGFLKGSQKIDSFMASLGAM